MACAAAKDMESPKAILEVDLTAPDDGRQRALSLTRASSTSGEMATRAIVAGSADDESVAGSKRSRMEALIDAADEFERRKKQTLEKRQQRRRQRDLKDQRARIQTELMLNNLRAMTTMPQVVVQAPGSAGAYLVPSCFSGYSGQPTYPGQPATYPGQSYHPGQTAMYAPSPVMPAVYPAPSPAVYAAPAPAVYAAPAPAAVYAAPAPAVYARQPTNYTMPCFPTTTTATTTTVPSTSSSPSSWFPFTLTARN
mmetsp:Transcript_11052/g.28095  ORF Transcript_11052/g.28095 Transcript_11052/m.28095 type:complete len:253 (+) Transcript_11052:53-811(+)